MRVEDALKAFREHGISFFTGVPDSLLKDICAYITDHASSDEHIIATNEGSAAALAIGHYLGTGEPALVYLQNSGLGNLVNPVLSLADPQVYGVPMVLMIGWRGEPGRPDASQHVKQGRVMLKMLEAMEIPYVVLDASGSPRDAIATCAGLAREQSTPVVLVVCAGTFEAYRLHQGVPADLPLSRETAVRLVLGHISDQAVVVSTTGKTSREVVALRASAGQGHMRDFLTVGGMGHASMIALGIALRQPQRPVVCIDGDGAALMHLGALTTVGTQGPPKFKHVLINNGAHDSVGGQPTSGFEVDFCAIALASRYRFALSAATDTEVAQGLDRLVTSDGPGLLEIRVRTGAREDLGRPTTAPTENRKAFMAWLGTTGGVRETAL